ncbi:dipeptide ABC transporter ATP-binding protein [Homoserinimonas sp. A520]
MNPVVSVQNLRVAFGQSARQVVAVDGLSFELAAGECLALVGESGSGKSVTARSLIGLAGAGARVSADRLQVGEHAILELRQGELRSIRGKEVGLVLQDALVSLDPLRPIGREIDDSLRLHTSLSPAARRTRVLELLESVSMPQPEQRMLQRSGELSGGLRQRALIASAIALNPGLLIADEPTTALDVTIQAQILDLLAELKNAGTALLLISHDLAVVSGVADRVAVMQDGRIVEQGATAEVLGSPEHPYTRALIAAVPSAHRRGERLSAEPARTLEADVRPKASSQPGSLVLEATDLTKEFALRHGRRLRAADQVSLQLRAGGTLGLVGESGSGKTTVARMILGLTEPDAGAVTLLGEPWVPLLERERRGRRALLGGIYQDPLSSFDPRHTVEQVLTDAVTSGRSIRDAGARKRVGELLDAVGLPSTVGWRRPLHLSGGQRQRVAIARALAANPRIIVCDEPVSALDVSVQAQVLDLLTDLQRELGLSYLFISHDLGVVQHMSDTVAVMRDGRIVETGVAAEVFDSPAHDYTRQLVEAAPRLPERTE